jgi:prophage antirepressor-like protein
MNIVKVFSYNDVAYPIRLFGDIKEKSRFGVSVEDLVTALEIDRENLPYEIKYKSILSVLGINGSLQNIEVLWEPELFLVILKSDSPHSDALYDWIWEDAFPSVRNNKLDAISGMTNN